MAAVRFPDQDKHHLDKVDHAPHPNPEKWIKRIPGVGEKPIMKID